LGLVLNAGRVIHVSGVAQDGAFIGPYGLHYGWHSSNFLVIERERAFLLDQSRLMYLKTGP
jgi:uncharacterized membrane protein YecN with MAPEG domain